MRYFFEVSYKGSAYHGWQSQNNATGVQQVIEDGIFTLTQNRLEITGSGRTDTGVHAIQQFFHADFPVALDPADFRHHLNAVIPKDIFIRNIFSVRDDAHARYDATKRTYQYRLIREKDPFLLKEAYIYRKELRLDLMNEAIALLIGKHDFQAFSKVRTNVNHYICDIFDAQWKQEGALSCFNISADRFLRGMVRAIVGTLLMINEGKLQISDLLRILESKDRRVAGGAVPADGLYLMQVSYPKDVFI